VVYVLDEPSAGLHPHDTRALLRALDTLKQAGNSLFVVEHELDVVRCADWLVDVGPAAGSEGGEILYSGPPAGLRAIPRSHTRRYLFAEGNRVSRSPRKPRGWLHLKGIHLHNLTNLDASFPLGVLTTVTGISGSGKSTLVSRVLVDLIAEALGHSMEESYDDSETRKTERAGGALVGGLGGIRRLIRVDQKPIGRTPRSNMATYTGLFDHVRHLFAQTKAAKQRKYSAGRFSFNVASGRCDRCAGEGFVCVELLFLPSVYSPCPVCHGSRFNAKTLEVQYRGKNIAQVLGMTVDEALAFFADEPPVLRSLATLREVGLGYLRLGQPATELSGGEAQRIKLATELQRAGRGDALYVLDEPTTGLHPLDVERLLQQLHALVDAGNSVVVIEHDMEIIAASDWIIDMGPGAGEEGGRIVADGTPQQIASAPRSMTAPFLNQRLRLAG
jgi:excinuclease ABC subunit A